MALHIDGPTGSVTLRRWSLPRPHHPAPHISTQATQLSFPHTIGTVRGKPPDLSQHFGLPRGDMDAGVGRENGFDSLEELHGGTRHCRASGWDGSPERGQETPSEGEQKLEVWCLLGWPI